MKVEDDVMGKNEREFTRIGLLPECLRRFLEIVGRPWRLFTRGGSSSQDSCRWTSNQSTRSSSEESSGSSDGSSRSSRAQEPQPGAQPNPRLAGDPRGTPARSPTYARPEAQSWRFSVQGARLSDGEVVALNSS